MFEQFIKNCYEEAVNLKEKFKITENKPWTALTVTNEMIVQLGHYCFIICNTDYTEAIHNLKELKFAIAIDSERYDCGSKLGLVKANVALALKDKEISEELKKYLKDITKKMEE